MDKVMDDNYKMRWDPIERVEAIFHEKGARLTPADILVPLDDVSAPHDDIYATLLGWALAVFDILRRRRISRFLIPQEQRGRASVLAPTMPHLFRGTSDILSTRSSHLFSPEYELNEALAGIFPELLTPVAILDFRQGARLARYVDMSKDPRYTHWARYYECAMANEHNDANGNIALPVLRWVKRWTILVRRGEVEPDMMDLWRRRPPPRIIWPHVRMQERGWLHKLERAANGDDSVPIRQWVSRTRLKQQFLSPARRAALQQIDLYAPPGMWGWDAAFALVNGTMGGGDPPRAHRAWIARQQERFDELTDAQRAALAAAPWWAEGVTRKIMRGKAFLSEQRPTFAELITELHRRADEQPNDPPAALMRPQKWYRLGVIEFGEDSRQFIVDVDVWAGAVRSEYRKSHARPHGDEFTWISELRGWQW